LPTWPRGTVTDTGSTRTAETLVTTKTYAQTATVVEKHLLTMRGTVNEANDIDWGDVSSQQFFTFARQLKISFKMRANQQILVDFGAICIQGGYLYGGKQVSAFLTCPDVEKWDFHSDYSTELYAPLNIPDDLVGEVPLQLFVLLVVLKPTFESNPAFSIDWEIAVYEMP